MRLSQIKNKNDLPKSFLLDRYLPTFKFTISDWVNNLEARSLSLYMQSPKFEEYFHEATHRSEYFLLEPIRIFPDGIGNTGLSKYIRASNVCDFEAMDFGWHGFEYATDERYKKYTDAHKDYADEDKPFKPERDVLLLESILNIPFYKMLNDCGFNSDGNVLAKIDLHGSDEKIMSDFSSWLKSTRQEMNIDVPKKKFTQCDFDEWAKNSILPYLDLTLWASANKVEITQQLLGTTLFPDEYDVNLAERIRKVIAPAAKKMVRTIFCDALRSQATAELAE